MGQYLRTMPNDLILSLIYPNILAISSWEDQTQVFQSWRLCNKAWNKLINSGSQWLNTKLCLLVLHFERQATLEVKKNYNGKTMNPKAIICTKVKTTMSFNDSDGASNDLQ